MPELLKWNTPNKATNLLTIFILMAFTNGGIAKASGGRTCHERRQLTVSHGLHSTPQRGGLRETTEAHFLRPRGLRKATDGNCLYRWSHFFLEKSVENLKVKTSFFFSKKGFCLEKIYKIIVLDLFCLEKNHHSLDLSFQGFFWDPAETNDVFSSCSG